MCRGRISILQLLLVTTYSTFAQDVASNPPANLTLSLNETKQDSTITWIKISPITPNISTTEATLKNPNILNSTITENTSGENQNIDFPGSLRRKRRKRRRNKYKAWNQRRPEHSHKKHSTKVEITKPVQFLIPPDYQENLIPKESSYYKSRNDVVEKFSSRPEKKIPPPVRHLLPPLVDTRFINSVTPASVSVQPEPKKSKYIDWSPNSTNRGLTKFKHTVYYSDSGNEIISNYEITSTTPKPQIKFTTSDDTRVFTPSRVTTEIPRNYKKLEYRPIVVQPTPVQYHTTPVPFNNHTTAFPSRETRINSLLSFEVANAGMQIINMTNFQKQNSPSFQNQFVQNNNNKQFEPPAVSRSANYQQIPAQQSTAHPINYQQSPSQDRASQQINYQQQQSQQLANYRQSQPQDQSYQQPQPQQVSNYQKSQSPERISPQINYQQPQPQQQSNYQQSQSPERISPQLNYQQQQQHQQISNYQQSQSPDRISQQINYQQTPSPEQIPQQINYQQLPSQHQHKATQNQQTRLSQPQINYQQSQPQQQSSRQSNYQQYQSTQLPAPSPASNSQNFQQIEHLQPQQTYQQQSLQNYQSQATYSRAIDQRTTTPISDLAFNRTTTAQIDKTDNFKGLDLAESKYFSDIPSEQEFNAVNDGQVIPGIAGKDYPVFDQFLLQKRRFHCRGLEGYFADVTSRCQVFYICNGDGAGEPMLCPNGTLFSQELLVCDWWYNVDC